MAPTPEMRADPIRWWHVLFYIAGSLMIGAIVGSQGVMWRDSHKPVPEMSAMERHEQATVAMIRMGFQDWVAVCAWQSGKDGATRAAALRACTIQFGIGEPTHPERRAGR